MPQKILKIPSKKSPASNIVPRIKVSGISSLTDARYCAGMGVEYLSLIFGDQPVSMLKPEDFRSVRPWIEGVKWMAEYSGNDAAVLNRIMEDYQPDAVLLDYSLIFESGGAEIWSRISAGDFPDSGMPGNFQLHFIEQDISGIFALLERIAECPGNHILENYLEPEMVLQLSERFPDLIFNLNSSVEERPGWMDLGLLQDYLEALGTD